MSQQLAAIEDKELLESGLQPARHPRDVPLWADGRNVSFRQGGPQKIGGWSQVTSFTPNGEPRGAAGQRLEDGTLRLIFGDENELYRWESGTITSQGSGYTGNNLTQWSITFFGNWAVATNGVDAPQVDKNDGNGFVDLGTGGNFNTAEVMLRRDAHLIAANTSDGQTWVRWSDADAPETWTPQLNNLAGSLNVREMEGPIIAAVNVGSDIALIGKNQIAQIQFVGRPFVFGYEPRLDGIGAVSNNAVIEVNGLLFGMGEFGFWQTDLRSFEYIGTDVIWPWVVQRLNTFRLRQVHCDYDSETETITWFLPNIDTNEVDIGVMFNVQDGWWSILDWGRTASISSLDVFTNPLRLSGSGVLYEHGQGKDADGSPLRAWVRSKPLDFGDPRLWKYVDVVLPELRRFGGTVRVRVGWQQHINSPVEWQPWKDVHDEFEDVFFRLAGRFIKFEIEADDTGGDFLLSGLQFYGQQAGRGF